MSDNWVTFLSLDASESEAAEIIDRQLQWLLDREIVAPTENTDRFYGDYREGARFSEACDPRWVPSDAIAGGWHILFGVRIEKGWQISSNMNGFEPPPCPRCGEHLAADLMGELLTSWHDSRSEPIVVCKQCGHTDSLGNWQHVFGAYGNYGSISFVNAFPLTKEFERTLLARMGGRPRKLYVHL